MDLLISYLLLLLVLHPGNRPANLQAAHAAGTSMSSSFRDRPDVVRPEVRRLVPAPDRIEDWRRRLVVLPRDRPQRHDADRHRAVGAEPVEQRVRGIGTPRAATETGVAGERCGGETGNEGRAHRMRRAAVKPRTANRGPGTSPAAANQIPATDDERRDRRRETGGADRPAGGRGAEGVPQRRRHERVNATRPRRHSQNPQSPAGRTPQILPHSASRGESRYDSINTCINSMLVVHIAHFCP